MKHGVLKLALYIIKHTYYHHARGLEVPVALWLGCAIEDQEVACSNPVVLKVSPSHMAMCWDVKESKHHKSVGVEFLPPHLIDSITILEIT